MDIVCIVYVRWLDARGASPNWQTINDLTETPCEIRSVGYLVKNKMDHIVIAPHVAWEEDPDDREACGVMYIPRENIIEMISWYPTTGEEEQ